MAIKLEAETGNRRAGFRVLDPAFQHGAAMRMHSRHGNGLPLDQHDILQRLGQPRLVGTARADGIAAGAQSAEAIAAVCCCITRIAVMQSSMGDARWIDLHLSIGSGLAFRCQHTTSDYRAGSHGEAHRVRWYTGDKGYLPFFMQVALVIEIECHPARPRDAGQCPATIGAGKGSKACAPLLGDIGAVEIAVPTAAQTHRHSCQRFAVRVNDRATHGCSRVQCDAVAVLLQRDVVQRIAGRIGDEIPERLVRQQQGRINLHGKIPRRIGNQRNRVLLIQ